VKNVTVSLPAQVYRRARIKAAERDTSLSALVLSEDLSHGAGYAGVRVENPFVRMS
jgi:hypothetical protein